MAGLEHHHIYEFGGFRLDSAQRLLFGVHGERIVLTSRAFDTLLFMVEHPGELLDTDTLMQAVWPNLIVEDNSLQQIITALRRALGEKPDDHRFIVTSRGQGYRFVAPVHSAAPGEDAPPPVARSERHWRRPALWTGGLLAIALLVAAIYFPLTKDNGKTAMDAKSVTVTAVPSIAVLPFTDLSPDGDQGYFSRGISEELRNQFTQLKGLRVAGPASSLSVAKSNMDVRAIGDALGVGNILQGSVRKDGDRVRISAQLINAANGYQIWSKTYERQLGDIFAIQSGIAKAVAGALSIALDIDAGGILQGTGTRNFEAYDNYLAADMALQIASDLSLATLHLDRAIKLDPNYADAWAGLAVVYFLSANQGSGGADAMRKMGDAAARAVELDPDLPAGHIMLGSYNITQSDWPAAEREYKAAIALSESVVSYGAYGVYLGRVGRIAAARTYNYAALELEPLDPLGFGWRAMMETAQGRFDDAMSDIDRQEELGDIQAVIAWPRLVVALSERDAEEVRKQLEAATRMGTAGALPLQSVLRDFDAPARALADLRESYADPSLDGATRNLIAFLAAYFDDSQFALDIWSEELRENKGHMLYLWLPVFSEMRRLPAFKSLMRDLNIVDYWRESGWPDMCRPVGDEDFSCS